MQNFLIILFLLCSINLHGQYDSLSWENINRTFLLHLPTGYNASEELPLVIAMHGGFGNAFNLQNQSQLSVKADMENFIVVYPEGVQGGTFDIRTWNAGWCCGHASISDIDDVGFINNLLDTLIESYAIDTNRIYATGMSNGGFMSYRLACELSDRIAAIAPVAASMSMVNCNPSRPMPVLDFHSYLDTNVPYLGGVGTGPSSQYSPPLDSVLHVWSNINTCQISNDTLIHNDQFTHIQWSDCSCNYLVEQFITTDGGHSWPGGEATPLGDPTSEFIIANDKMWEFFKNYSLDCSSVSTDDKEQFSSIVIYPNPVSDKLFLKVKSNALEIDVKVYDISGNLIMQGESTNEIDVSGLVAGTYILKMKMGEEVLVHKFLKLP